MQILDELASLMNCTEDTIVSRISKADYSDDAVWNHVEYGVEMEGFEITDKMSE
jgi:hypothetical protein